MKKSLFYIAVMALAVSCSNEMVDEIDMANDGAAETTFVNLNLTFEESIDTRISVDTDETETSAWKTAWEYGDEIFVYSIASGDYTTLSYNGTSFSGDVYTGDNRIYHKYNSNNLNIQEEDGAKYVALKANTTLFSNGGSPTVVSEEVINFTSDSAESIDVPMQQVGAAIDLKLQFSNLPDMFDLTLTYVTIGGVPDGGTYDDYTEFPTQIWTYPSADIDDTFVKYTETGARNYDCYTDIEDEATTYSMQFGVLPFTIEGGKKLNITLNFNYGALKYSFDVESIADFEFARARHYEIDYLIDLGDLLGDTWLADATPFTDTESTGTSGDPIEIKSEKELAYLSLITLGVIEGVSSDGVYYKLTTDLDLGVNEWSPIGGNASNVRFNGHFDGDNHTISNLTITEDSDGYNGLFGGVNDGSISNVKLADASIYGVWAIGGIAGHIENATISNCAVEGGTLTGEYSVGGIIGEAYNSSITECYNTGNVSGYYQVGGAVGFLNHSSITACYNTGAVSASSDWGNYFGGVVGYIEAYDNSEYDNNSVTSCYNVGSVRGSESNTDSKVGAIVGYIDNSEYTTVTACYYLPAAASTTDSYGGTSLSSVAELNDSMDSTYYTAGDSDSNILPSLMGETITFDYVAPMDKVDDFTSNGGITGDGYNSTLE